MGKSSAYYADPTKSTSSSRDTSKSSKATSSSGGSSSKSSSSGGGSRYGKPEIHAYPDGKRDGYSEPNYRTGDQRYYKESSLSDAYGGKR